MAPVFDVVFAVWVTGRDCCLEGIGADDTAARMAFFRGVLAHWARMDETDKSQASLIDLLSDAEPRYLRTTGTRAELLELARTFDVRPEDVEPMLDEALSAQMVGGAA